MKVFLAWRAMSHSFCRLNLPQITHVPSRQYHPVQTGHLGKLNAHAISCAPIYIAHGLTRDIQATPNPIIPCAI